MIERTLPSQNFLYSIPSLFPWYVLCSVNTQHLVLIIHDWTTSTSLRLRCLWWSLPMTFFGTYSDTFFLAILSNLALSESATRRQRWETWEAFLSAVIWLRLTLLSYGVLTWTLRFDCQSTLTPLALAAHNNIFWRRLTLSALTESDGNILTECLYHSISKM
jgi:hypothetical protein